MAKHVLADAYRAERATLLELARSLTEEQAAQVTQACPAWSIKDVFAHLAGIASDILSGNTEGAATEPWADAHVADRVDRTFAEVVDEWTTAGDGVSEIMDDAGEFFPLQLFVDQWTHGWDIRSAIGPAASSVPDLVVYEHFLDDFFAHMQERMPDGLETVTLQVAGTSFNLGDGPSIGTLELDLFEYARISMGRRSRTQLEALPWPANIKDLQPYIDLLVVWSVSPSDIIDPIS